ncbi:glycosyltransferase [Parapusillimonas granuli]|uniref:Glycosyltransferase family 4 protein n=1 Tax=Parapusillimonas granuli TaxID=380911 RepID=A0A853FV62_9BURK|nr:glycosyltransferase family 4 protein [Parapusillimonas granuli]MBB5213656.1 hypothetical protein [Parapusillimonas granuli]NYT48493.1 glycosyltransferase family 4 protein [Parapusillimonas granuli]
MTDTLRILTWHVHGNYLYSLTQLPHRFIVPVMPGNRPGYAALGPKIPWGSNVSMVPAEQLREQQFDCVIYQSRPVFEHDSRQLLSPSQRKLPSVYIEHNPPEPHPTDTRHVFRHDRGVLVHVTHYNALMWDAGDMPVAVIEHGVPEAPGVHYIGELERGIVVINNLGSRGRRVGADIYEWAQARMPLDLIGMGSETLKGGKGEVPNLEVPAFMARYRFFFTPIRYASLGLSLVEAMMAGLPVLGIAATELPHVIENGVNGYVDNRPSALLDVSRQLLADAGLARKWGAAAQRTARERFGIGRFVADWERLLADLTGRRPD